MDLLLNVVSILVQAFLVGSIFSSILEPYNSSRLIIGFDTFDGFISDNENDDFGI